MNDRTKGLLIILAGVICVSPDAVLVRYLSSNGARPWTIIFWKLLLSIPITAGYALYEAGGMRKLYQSVVVGRYYYAAAIPVQAVTDICFTLAFVFTSAANALLLINLNPLWCAVVGRLFLGDLLPRRTYIALVLALCCIIIIFVPEVAERKRHSGDGTAEEEDPYAETAVKGNFIALFTGFLLAAFITIVRLGGKSDKEINLVGAAALGASLSAIISSIVERGDVFPSSFWTASRSSFWLAVAGQGFGIGAVFVAIALAPRFITGAEVGLCILLEAVLGPLFVFIAYRDVPSKWTLIGGSLLLVVLALHESRPLFEKAKEVHRSISMRMSSRNLGGSTIIQRQIGDACEESDKAAVEKQQDAPVDIDPEEQNEKKQVRDIEAMRGRSSSDKWEDEDGR